MGRKIWKRSQLLALMLSSALVLSACGAGAGSSAAPAGNPPASSGTASSQASEASFPKTNLRFGTTSAENTVVVQTMKDFAKRVSEETGGAVTVDIFPASQLGSVSDMAQQTQMGVLDMCMTQPSNLAEMGAKNMAVLALPYIFKDYDQRWNVLTGDVGTELLDEVGKAGIKLRALGYFLDGARSFFTVKGKPIRSLEDIKGLKLRVADNAIDTDMVSALGASPTQTATSEMYSAMQSGIVDGAEQPIAGYYNGKYYEISKYLTLDEHTYNTIVVLFSEISWNKLSPELQAVLAKAWVEARDDSKQKVLDAEADYLKQVEEQGVEVIRLSDREKWEKAMDSVYKTHASDKMELVERIRAVQ